MMKAIVFLAVVAAASAASTYGLGYDRRFDAYDPAYTRGYQPSVFGNRFGKSLDYDRYYDQANVYGPHPYDRTAYPYDRAAYPRGRSLDIDYPATAGYPGYTGYNYGPRY